MTGKVTEYSLSNVPMKALFTLTVFEILLFKGRLVLSPTQQVQKAKGIRNSMANFSPGINITCATSRNLPAVENIQSFLACNNGSRYVLESKMDLQPVLKEFDME